MFVPRSDPNRYCHRLHCLDRKQMHFEVLASVVTGRLTRTGVIILSV